MEDGVKELLWQNGVLFLTGEINENIYERIVGEILALNFRKDLERIHLVINSGGGFCKAGFGIISVMEWSVLPVHTTGLGMVGSMALLVFMAGARGHRVIANTTSILSHRYFGGSDGNHSQLLASRKEHDSVHARIIGHYLRYSGVATKEELEQYLLRDVDTWLLPEEALDLGLADSIDSSGLFDLKTGSGRETVPEGLLAVND